MVLNPEQCLAKAAWSAARQAWYVDVGRLYEEIAEQWMLLADQITDGQQSKTVIAPQ